jgi:hypothetical protein
MIDAGLEALQLHIERQGGSVSKGPAFNPYAASVSSTNFQASMPVIKDN